MSTNAGIPYWGSKTWWLEETSTAGSQYAPETVRRAAEVMLQVFDKDWWDSAVRTGRHNAVVMGLLGQGLLPLRFMVEVGTDLIALSGAEGLEKKISHLKGDRSIAALLELNVAALFARGGLRVSFPKEGPKRVADALVETSGEAFALECKEVNNVAFERWVDLIMHGVTALLPQGKEGDPVIHVELDRRLSDIRLPEEKYAFLNAAFAAAAVRRIAMAIETIQKDQSVLPRSINVPGIATVTMEEPGSGKHSSVSGCEISLAGQLRQIIQNGLFRAAGQISEDLQGVVVVKSDFLPDPALADVVFDAAVREGPEAVRRVAVLLLLPQQYFGSTARPLLVLNRHLRQMAAVQEAIELVCNAWRAVVV